MTGPTSAPTDKTGKTGGPPGVPIWILIVENQTPLRIALVTLLEAESGISVVGLAKDGARAATLAAELRPNIVLIDIQMPGLTGIEATRRIYADPTLTAIRVLILTMFEIDDYVLGALRASACDFPLKDADPQLLVDVVCTVHEGQSLPSPQVLVRLVTRTPSTTSTGTPHSAWAGEIEALTPRQREVLLLIARGLPNSEIEVELGITRATRRSHITTLLTRPGTCDRAQLVIATYEADLISPR